jgi:hypothetical protein
MVARSSLLTEPWWAAGEHCGSPAGRTGLRHDHGGLRVSVAALGTAPGADTVSAAVAASPRPSQIT